MDIDQKVLGLILKRNLIVANDKILLALSGGPDSVFALHFFYNRQKLLSVKLFAAHLNHGLRGAESDADEKFCISLCEKLNMPLLTRKTDVKQSAVLSNKSLEEEARDIRYDFLQESAKILGCTKIITAHNLDDNTETVLLNLIKGTGPSGISGIPVKRGNIIRPFLVLSKKEILNYLQINEIPYCIDKSNKESVYERNFLRNDILPLIRTKLNPNLDEAIFRTSVNLQDFLESDRKRIDRLYKRNIKTDGEICRIDLKAFKNDAYTTGELIKKVFRDYLGIEFNNKLLTSLIDLSGNQVGKKLHFQDGFRAVRERDFIELFKENSNGQNEIKFKVGESVIFGNHEIETKIEDLPFISTKDNNEEFISADNLEDIFILRKWKSGDKFIPLGMKGEKLISDFLTDRKIPSRLRSEIFVLLNRNKIVWVVGLRINEKFKVTSSTKRICKLCLKN